MKEKKMYSVIVTVDEQNDILLWQEGNEIRLNCDQAKLVASWLIQAAEEIILPGHE
jgi:hypothetical protein